MHIWPYIIPLAVAAILIRRMIREQKPRTVRFGRLWLLPSLLLLVTLTTLDHEAFPGLIALVVFALAGTLGALIGWYRVHTIEFSRDAETGKITSQRSQFDILFVVGLIVLRSGLDSVLKNISLAAGPELVRAGDAMLLFTTAMLVARSIHTFVRARALLPEADAGAPMLQPAQVQAHPGEGRQGEGYSATPSPPVTAPSAPPAAVNALDPHS